MASEPTQKVVRDSKTGRFLPGTSGGPGRGNGRKLTDVLKDHTDPDELAKELIKLSRKAKQEHVRLEAIKYLYDRFEGKPKQQQEISGPDGGPVQTVYVTMPEGNDDSSA